jgi:hypothetical protein
MEIDRELDAITALHKAQKSMEDAIYLAQEELSSLQERHTELQNRYDTLQEQHETMREKYDSERHSWKEFRIWWQATIDRKRAAQTKMSDGRNKPDSPSSPSTPASSRKRKGQLSETEIGILDRVGLDYSGIAVAGPSEQQRKRLIRVKQQTDGDDKERSTERASASPVSPAKTTNKRSKSSGGNERSSPSRSPLQEVVNSAADPSDEHFQQDDLVELSRKDRNRRMEELKKNPLKHKGRGRYSAGISRDASTSKTINAEFEIAAENNGNVSYLHKAVVRDKAERKRMHAFDCECCSDWYKTVGDAPLRRHQDPRTIRAGRGDAEGNDASIHEDEESDAEEQRRQVHRQMISRHRDRGPPAATPPGFWDIDFPSTQKQEEVNQLVREEYQRKPAQMARDPRFKRRSLA